MKYNWGKGIPKYNESDIMTDKELLDFAMQIIKEFEFIKNGWDIVSENNNINDYPNFVVTKDGLTYFILVRAAIAPEMPVLSDDERNIMIEYSNSNNGIPLFAPVGFGSRDPERFDKSLALRGDGFYSNYVGLEEIKKTPKTEEKNEIEESKNEEKLDESKRKEYKIKIENKELTKEMLQKFFKKYKFTHKTSLASLKVGSSPDDGQIYTLDELFSGCNFFYKFEDNYLVIKLDNKGMNCYYPLAEKNIRMVDNLVIDIKEANGYDINSLPARHDLSDIEDSKKNKVGFFSKIFGKKN